MLRTATGALRIGMVPTTASSPAPVALELVLELGTVPAVVLELPIVQVVVQALGIVPVAEPVPAIGPAVVREQRIVRGAGQQASGQVAELQHVRAVVVPVLDHRHVPLAVLPGTKWATVAHHRDRPHLAAEDSAVVAVVTTRAQAAAEAATAWEAAA